MVHCVAFGCKSKLSKGCGIHFFQFPKDEPRRKQWIHYCKRADFTEATPASTLCSKHFSGAQYDRDPAKLAQYGYTNARPKLKNDAVPDIPINVGTSVTLCESGTTPTAQKPSRGAYEKPRRSEVLKSILETATTSAHVGDSSSSMTEEATTQDEESEASCISSNISCSYPTVTTECIKPLKRTKDVGFQINCKRAKMNTKRYQIRPTTRSFYVQATPSKKTIGTQYDIRDIPEEAHCDTFTEGEDGEGSDSGPEVVEDQTDGDYIPSEEENSDDDLCDTEINVEEMLQAKEPHKERQFLVTESCLLDLLNKCQACGQSACVTLKALVGTMIVVDVMCIQGHNYTWRSQVCNNTMPWGNLLLASAILFSGSSPAKALNMMKHLNVPVISPRTFSNLQYGYLVPSVLRTWDLEQADRFNDLQGQDLTIGGDARCDSPGHSAKFGSYTLMNLNSNKIMHVELVQSNEVKGSYHMELEGLKRGLDYLNDCGLTVSEIVTDRHVQVKKYMSDKQTDKEHYFDVWHVAKGVSKKLEQAAKKKECGPIRPWIKSTVNHLYWVAATCGKNGDLKKAKWSSIVNHVSNQHDGHDELFPKCEHGPIVEQKKWIKSGSRAYKAFLAVVKSPYLLRDLGKLTPIHQTYGLEVYHNIVNHFAPKSTHFFYESMLARIHLAALHYNENSDKKQSKTKSGTLRYKVYYPKAKKGEQAVVKPTKQEPTYEYIMKLQEMVISRRRAHVNYKLAKADARHIIGDVPEAVSSGFKKFDKQDLIDKHKSRFAK